MNKFQSLILLMLLSLFHLKAQESPNIILILIDDQGWASTSTPMDPNVPESMSDYYETPNMDALFEQSTIFSQAYAPGSFCIPSRRSIQTGQSCARLTFNTKDATERGVEFTTAMSLPRVLKASNPNYITAHLGKWHLENDFADPGIMGYDIHDGNTDNWDGDANEPGTKQQDHDAYPYIQKDPKKVFSLTDRANHFMEDQVAANKPFFLQLSHYAVHLQVCSTQESLDHAWTVAPGEKHVMPHFKAMIEDMDKSIGQLMDKIQELGIQDNTYIIFTSDNGFRGDIAYEEPIDPDIPEDEQDRPYAERQSNWTKEVNYPLQGAKHQHLEGGIRVPFTIFGPGVSKNTYSQVPVSSLDLLPTFAEIVNYTGEINNIDGGSLLNVLNNNGKGIVNRPYDFFVIHGAERSALIQGDYKLYVDYKTETTSLFKPLTDPSELNDLSASQPDILTDMKTSFDNYLEEVEGSMSQMSKKAVHIRRTGHNPESIDIQDDMFLMNVKTEGYIHTELRNEECQSKATASGNIKWNFIKVGTENLIANETGLSALEVNVYNLYNSETGKYVKITKQEKEKKGVITQVGQITLTNDLEDTDDFKVILEPTGIADTYYIRRYNSKVTLRYNAENILVAADGLTSPKTGAIWKWELSIYEALLNTATRFKSEVQNHSNNNFLNPGVDTNPELPTENDLIDLNDALEEKAGWIFTKIKDGKYTIKNQVTGSYLMNEDDKVVLSAIQIYVDDYTWELHETEDHEPFVFYVKNTASGQYITYDVADQKVIYGDLKHNNEFKWKFANDIPADLPVLPLEDEVSTNIDNDIKSTKKRISVAPNPCNHQITIIDHSLQLSNQYYIYDIVGALKQSGKLNQNRTINIKNMVAGVYVLKIPDINNNIQFAKFIKK